jgi:hypothetical protein
VVHPCDPGLAAVGIGRLVDLPQGNAPQQPASVTRFDKIVGESDRAKVMKRVKQETDGLFAEVFPVSLLQAMRAGDDEAKWLDSGVDAFTRALFDIVHRIIDEGHPEPGDEGKPAIQPDLADATEVGQSLIAQTFERLMAIRNTPVFKVLPRRVAAGERLLRTERPTEDRADNGDLSDQHHGIDRTGAGQSAQKLLTSEGVQVWAWPKALARW